MIKYIRERFYKKELADLFLLKEALEYDIKREEDYLEKKEEKLNNKEKELKELAENTLKTKNRKAEEIFKEQLEQSKNTLKKLVDFDLLPWNKVWGQTEYDNRISEVEITDIIIDKERITINNSWCFWIRYFKTEKEAIKDYNKHLESLKK